MVTRRNAPAVILLTVALFALVLIPLSTGLLVDFWWFRELGFTVLFSKTLTTRLLLFGGAALTVGALVFFNLRLAQRGIVPDTVKLQLGLTADAPHVDVAAGVKRVSTPAAVIVGLFFGLSANGLWDVVLQAVNQTPFGTTDPIFGRDVAYYVFTLPALAAILAVVASIAVILLLMLVVVYFVRGDIVVLPHRLRVEPAAGMHLAVILATLFVVWALQLWFVDSSTLLFSRTGPLVGASYTDMHATLPALRVSAFTAIFAAAFVIFGGIKRQLGFNAVVAIGVYVVIAVVGRLFIPSAMQKFVVAPTELTREEPYLAHHLIATRQAWGIDSVEVRDLAGEANMTLASIRANGPTVDNVRLWDRDPLLRTFSQIQEIRTYYDFISVDDDRYWIDGRYRQVLLAPRELNSASLPTRTFINEHLTFTHGMGLTMSPVNQVTAEGLPVLFIKDLPPSATGSLKVTRPQIYFGELTNQYVFVDTKQKEFDYPAGDENIYRSYDGTGGVPVGNILRRLVLAAHFGSSKILLSGDIQSTSRVLYHRNIVERAQKAFPFLQLDRDPYMVVRDSGNLVWIQDAYTTTARYPYSYRSDNGTSYMRNSVKIVIDAYHGTVTPYVSSPSDPLIQTWEKVYPGVFRPLSDMPADLRAHLRYPDDLYRAQSMRYVTYHMNTPATFYNREDEWQVPIETRNDQAVPFMRHIIMRLPDEDTAEFIYMTPFTPRGKDNLAAWMVARNDGDHYGKLRVYRFPRQSLIFGPRQIESRINQDTEISRQVSLWDQRGSQVIRGDLLVIPIEESLLYVQPIYLQSDGGMIPELKRVVIAYQNQVLMRETLDAALEDMFGGSIDSQRATVVAATDSVGAMMPAAPVQSADALRAAMIADAQRRYSAAMDAQRQGDWARYGEEIKQLGAILDRLAASRPPQ